MLHQISLVILSVITVAFAAIGPDANLYLINGNVSPDGFNRSAVLASADKTDATLAGPVITAKKGDHMRINVTNLLNDSTMEMKTSIHWHGLFMNGSSWADGAAGVTQCPLLPGKSFLYEFDLGDQAGTFWYHSHLSTQYCDGLRGALIIYDPHDPYRPFYDIDDENTIITLTDWYHYPAPSIQPRPSKGIFPSPNSTLINNLGRFPNGDATPLAVINVVQGKRYRFRLVSISCDANHKFSIDGHDMTIIEVDGVNTRPLTVDSIQIFAGQRYSVVVAANQPVGNYWVRARPNIGYTNTTFDGGLNSAILRYKGSATVDPQTNSTVRKSLRETDLHPLDHPGAPGGNGDADVSYYLDMKSDRTRDVFTINNFTYTDPPLPVLLQILSGAHKATDLLPKGSVYVLPPNKTIEISFSGGVNGYPHPFHLHGHTFDVVRSAGSSVYNYKNPVRRDVVSTGDSNDNVTIRFTTDNSGPWFLHCHIDWHLEAGMAIVFAEDVDTITKSNLTQPPAWRDLCPLYKNTATLN